jgi:HEAT repeat protein
MADRKDTVVLSAVLKAATNGPRNVRIAAVNAMGRVGNATCLSPLLEMALDADADLAKASKTALADLPSQDVNKEIVARMSGAKGKIYPLLIELVGERRIQAVPDLVAALDNSDDAVRSAALTSLGTTVPADQLSVLISQVVSPKNPKDQPIAEKALKEASVRMGDREKTPRHRQKSRSSASWPMSEEPRRWRRSAKPPKAAMPSCRMPAASCLAHG